MAAGVFLDPVAPLLVCGGAAAIAAVRSTADDCGRALAALGPFFRAHPEADAQAARVAVNRIAERASATGIATVDRVARVERFFARAAILLAEVPGEAVFRRWGEDEIAARAARHDAAQAVWRAAADAAPAMGMIGTVLGLIGMFSGMDDPAAIGPGMALALTTTLWGIVVANVIAGPVAARLERLTRAELDWQRAAIDRLAPLAEAAPVVAARVTRIRPAA